MLARVGLFTARAAGIKQKYRCCEVGCKEEEEEEEEEEKDYWQGGGGGEQGGGFDGWWERPTTTVGQSLADAAPLLYEQFDWSAI